jgi:hypothetical protein
MQASDDDPKILTVEIAYDILNKRYDQARWNELTSIEDEAAEVLASHQGCLWLDGLPNGQRVVGPINQGESSPRNSPDEGESM